MAAPLAPDPAHPRHRLLACIGREPGLHFRALSRATGLPAGQLRHHLDRLRRDGYLIEVEDGGYTRFFLVGNHAPRLRPAMAVLGRAGPRRIARALLLRPMRRAELREVLRCADSTLSFHLARLLQAGIVLRDRAGGAALYSLADVEGTREALRAGANPEEALPPTEFPAAPALPAASPQADLAAAAPSL